MSRLVASEKNLALALNLATGTGTYAAAHQHGISPRTVQRKLANPEFRRLVAELRDELIGRALGRLADNMTLASDQIAALLKDENPALRLRAARALLSFGLRLRDSLDLTDRVREIERDLAAKGAHQ
jgi:hypothetical protein